MIEIKRDWKDLLDQFLSYDSILIGNKIVNFGLKFIAVSEYLTRLIQTNEITQKRIEALEESVQELKLKVDKTELG